MEEAGPETIKTKRLAGEDSARVEAKAFNQTLQAGKRTYNSQIRSADAGLGCSEREPFQKAKRAANQLN